MPYSPLRKLKPEGLTKNFIDDLDSDDEVPIVHNNDRYFLFLSNKWVDYVEEPMKYQALRPPFSPWVGWGWWGWWWCGGWGWQWVGMGVGGVGRGGVVGLVVVGWVVVGVQSGGRVVGGVIRLSF